MTVIFFAVVTNAKIADAASRIGRAASAPAKVILFGSRARGQARPDSDVDFLVIEESVKDLARERSRLRSVVPRLGVGVDVVVTTNEEADYWGQAAGHMIRRALREGRVLYDAQ